MAGGGNSQFPGQGVKSSATPTSLPGAFGQAAQQFGQPSQFGQAFGGAGRFTQFNPGVQRNTFTPQQYAAPQMSPGIPQAQGSTLPGFVNARNPWQQGARYGASGLVVGDPVHDNAGGEFAGMPIQGGFNFGGMVPWQVGQQPQQPQTMPGRDIGVIGRRSGPWNEVM